MIGMKLSDIRIHINIYLCILLPNPRRIIIRTYIDFCRGYMCIHIENVLSVDELYFFFRNDFR